MAVTEASQSLNEGPNQATQTSIMQVVSRVIEDLGTIEEAMNSSPNANPRDKEEMAGIRAAFSDLVERKVAEMSGGRVQASAPVPTMAGENGIPLGPQSRM